MHVRRIACALLVLSACDSPSAPDGGSRADAASSSDAAVQVDAGFVPAEPTLPSATGACPDFSASGRITVSPSGVAPREVQLWISDAAATLDGPLVFYWHGTGSRPEEAQYGLGPETMDAILALGGMVIAPTHDPAAGDFPGTSPSGPRTTICASPTRRSPARSRRSAWTCAASTASA
ncbi:MAG: hypothetical protein M5U28_37130 [Sandaracinaceae bacterium]|nr:hypothetical protein [Sandaracinaceae bacterium]